MANATNEWLRIESEKVAKAFDEAVIEDVLYQLWKRRTDADLMEVERCEDKVTWKAPDTGGAPYHGFDRDAVTEEITSV